MNFKNFDVFPIGNAELSIVDNKLRVCNKSNSGCDGVFIQNKDGKNLCISYISGNKQKIWQKKDSMLSGTNFSFLQNDFKIKGYLNNYTVFELSYIEIENIEYLWWKESFKFRS